MAPARALQTQASLPAAYPLFSVGWWAWEGQPQRAHGLWGCARQVPVLLLRGATHYADGFM